MLKDVLPDWSVPTRAPMPRSQSGETTVFPDQALSFEVELDRATLIRNDIWGFEHRDVRTRSFVLLRSQLMNRFHGPGGRVLAVTSAGPGDGKTFVAANLAAALSRIHPTVLVDLDLRRPVVAQRFGIDTPCGVDDFLNERAEWQATGRKVAGAALTIHGAREPVASPADLLAADRLKEAFQAMRASPDAPLCIIDTPPVLMLDDANLIASHVDGILIVVDEGKTRAQSLQEALRLLSPTPIVGSVLNRSLSISKSSIDYAYYEGSPPSL